MKTIADATRTADEIVLQAKERAATEGRKEFEKAIEQIAAERDNAIAQISEHVASLSIAVAEKILRGELKDPDAAKDYLHKMAKEL
jgi:F-type H+-transporting ATPase subunit b